MPEPGRPPFGLRLHHHREAQPQPSASLSPEAQAVRQRLKDLEWENLKLLLPRLAIGDKMLLIISWLEAQNSAPVHRQLFRAQFARTTEPMPANPGRDLKNLIHAGLLHAVDERSASVTETGWIRVGQLAGPDEEPGAAAVLA